MLITKEATHREEVLESKLTALQRQLQSAQEATEGNWQVDLPEIVFCSHLLKTVNLIFMIQATLACKQ